MKGIYYRDKVIINVSMIAKIDASRIKQTSMFNKDGVVYPISFYNAELKMIARWDFQEEEERISAFESIKESMGAIEL